VRRDVGLHHIAVPKFYVRDTFEIPDRRLFVMAGSIVEGEIRAGMFLRVGFDSALDMTARIHSIEFARRLGGEDDVCLCFEAEPELLEIWRGLKIGDETFEVTQDGSD
jgi:hypothetical protein